MIGSIIILILSTIAILLFHLNNKYRKIERYYYNTNKSLFVLLELSILVLVLGFLYHIKFVGMKSIIFLFNYIKLSISRY
jgi:hypothetical protein